MGKQEAICTALLLMVFHHKKGADFLALFMCCAMEAADISTTEMQSSSPSPLEVV